MPRPLLSRYIYIYIYPFRSYLSHCIEFGTSEMPPSCLVCARGINLPCKDCIKEKKEDKLLSLDLEE